MLECDDVERSAAFYKDVLGFQMQGSWQHEGVTVWVCLARDGVELMLCARNQHSTILKPTMSGSIYISVDDADEAWDLLRGKAKVEYPIENFDYNMREFAIRDLDGYLVQFGHEIS